MLVLNACFEKGSEKVPVKFTRQPVDVVTEKVKHLHQRDKRII